MRPQKRVSGVSGLLPWSTTVRGMSRIFSTSVASVYPHYVRKVERKGRTRAELQQVIEWLTGFDGPALDRHLASGTTFEDFFGAARLNPHASSITGVISTCEFTRSSVTATRPPLGVNLIALLTRFQITGVICGVRIEDIDDPLMQKIRYLDKLVDELAKGRSMDKILRA